MKIALIAVAGLATVASAQSADTYRGSTYSISNSSFTASRAPAQLGIGTTDVVCLWDNGPFETSPGNSTLPVGDTIFGYGNQAPPIANSVGDDFTVSGGGWNVANISFFGYQSFTGTAASTFTAVNLTIYSGAIGNTANVVYSTSGLASSVFTGVYRNTVVGNTDRPIFENNVNTPGLSLPDGQYWMSWNAAGTAASGPWAPPVTPVAASPNGVQQIGAAGAWAPVLNGGHGDDFPFCINGDVVPAPASLALMGLGGLFAGRRRR